ncbi:MAG: DUF202 domain-containing protein [Chloroflexota bacterium]|nr:DUF202 domain-containing protein [Chloroflexota bacterium]
MDTDSRSRSLLANERTFLAWVRTSLSMITIAVAAAQFIAPDERNGVNLVTLFSIFLVVSGVGATVLAGLQFRQARERINSGTYQSGTTAIALTVGITVVVGLIAVGIVLFLRQPG